MQLNLDPQIKADHELESQVRRASKILDEVIGPTAYSTSANWKLNLDAPGRRSFDLELTDSFGARAIKSFTPDDLNKVGFLYAKFYKIWGDLLQIRSHQQFDRLSGADGSSGE